MTELEAIREEIRKHEPCDAQFGPFCQAIECGDDLTAWQTLLGSRIWLRYKGVALPTDLEAKAGYTARRWHRNGLVNVLAGFKDGRYDGPYRVWDLDGKLTVHTVLSAGDDGVVRMAPAED